MLARNAAVAHLRSLTGLKRLQAGPGMTKAGVSGQRALIWVKPERNVRDWKKTMDSRARCKRRVTLLQ